MRRQRGKPMPGNLLRLQDHGGKARLIEGATVKREPHPARPAWTGGVGDIDWAGDATVLLGYVKRRTAAESMTLPRKAVRLLEQWLEHSALTREHVAGGPAWRSRRGRARATARHCRSQRRRRHPRHRHRVPARSAGRRPPHQGRADIKALVLRLARENPECRLRCTGSAPAPRGQPCVGSAR